MDKPGKVFSTKDVLVVTPFFREECCMNHRCRLKYGKGVSTVGNPGSVLRRVGDVMVATRVT